MLISLIQIVLEGEKDFFTQARENEPVESMPDIQDSGLLELRDETKSYTITTQRKDENIQEKLIKHYFTTIYDITGLIDAHQGKRKDSVFAHTSTDSFEEAMKNHFSSLNYLKKLGY